MTTRFNGKSIPTIYNDVPFRSRLEARWAVFFDGLQTPWEYEPENYLTELGPYLPDFYLPELDKFFIVKGDSLPEEEERKCYEVARMTGKEVIMAIGGMPQFFSDDDRHFQLYSTFGDWPWYFCRCTCGTLTFQWNGLGGRHCDPDKSDNHESGTNSEEILYALALARSAKYGVQFT